MKEKLHQTVMSETEGLRLVVDLRMVVARDVRVNQEQQAPVFQPKGFMARQDTNRLSCRGIKT